MYPDLPQVVLNVLRNSLSSIAFSFVLGNISGLPAVSAIQGPWYNSLRTPWLRPPVQAFGPIWALLYCSMGYAAHIGVQVFDESPNHGSRKHLAYTGLGWYVVQLALNLSYTTLFFGWRQITVALFVVLGNTATAIAMTKDLHKASDGATTWYLAPYCAWLVYATYLNIAYLYLNWEEDGKVKASGGSRRKQVATN